MFENQAKGWHGSYSTVGRNSAEKYPMVLIKDKILKDKCEKKIIKDYFNTDDDLESNKIIIDDGEDIFSQTMNKKNKHRKRITEICDHQAKEKIPEEYKYHQHHHKELFEYNLLLKKQKNYGTNSSMYAPKKDITWRRTVTGPYWDSLTGREKNSLFRTPDNTEANFYIDHDTFKSENKTFQMEKQTKRGQLPTSYDLRIRIDEPFNINNDNKKNLIKTKISEYLETGETSKNEKSKIIPKKRDNNNKKNNHSLSFAKTLSREQYYFLNRDRRGVRPFFSPNYNLVEPKSLSMVKYNQKPKGKSISKRMKGIDSNLFFEPYKCMNKVNNHFITNAPNLKIMVGRVDDFSKDRIHLPGHMIKIFNRNSLEVLTEKGLKMNNFVDADLGNDYSSFCNKKSFNFVINHNLLKNSNNANKNTKLDAIAKKLNTKERINKLMEFYSKNLDSQNLTDDIRKFDGITFKAIKNSQQLSEKEKKLFSLKFDN